MNIKKNLSLNPMDALHNLCTRLMLSGKIYLYGQGFAAPAAMYLASYLRILLPNVCCVNQLGQEPLSSAAGMDAGDLLLCIGFPAHQRTTMELLAYAREQEVCTAIISESHDSPLAKEADISLIAECGDFGLGGSIAPLISLCSIHEDCDHRRRCRRYDGSLYRCRTWREGHTDRAQHPVGHQSEYHRQGPL